MGEIGSCEPLVTTFASTNQYTTLFYAWFCLKTLYLTYFVDLLTLNSCQHPYSSCLNQTYLKISMGHNSTAFLCLRVLASPWAQCLGVMLNSKITNTKCKNMKNVAVNGHLFAKGDLEQESKGSPRSSSAENPHFRKLKSFVSLHICEWLRKHRKYWYQGYKHQVGEFAQRESTYNENWLF